MQGEGLMAPGMWGHGRDCTSTACSNTHGYECCKPRVKCSMIIAAFNGITALVAGNCTSSPRIDGKPRTVRVSDIASLHVVVNVPGGNVRPQGRASIARDLLWTQLDGHILHPGLPHTRRWLFLLALFHGTNDAWLPLSQPSHSLPASKC